MNDILLERLRKEMAEVPRRKYKGFSKRKSTFVDHNDYTAEYVRKSLNLKSNNSVDTNISQEKGPQLVKRK